MNSDLSNAIPVLLPPHGEIPPTFWEQHGWTLVMCGIVLLLLAEFLIWLLRRPKPFVVLPPEVQARRALEAFRNQTESGAALSQISQVIRRYIADAFHLPPGELTTAEFCREIAGREQIGPELAAALDDFLRRCDERKFAPAAASTPLGAVMRALELVELAETRRTATATTKRA